MVVVVVGVQGVVVVVSVIVDVGVFLGLYCGSGDGNVAVAV